MKGTLYGVSVGAGDPELITLKAIKIINLCEIIAVPRTNKKNTLALDIAEKVCDINGKELLYLDFPMIIDKKMLEKCHEEIADQLYPFLKTGKNIAFLNIGDISIYSTFSYIAALVQKNGFEVEICPGVPSFCAIAAKVKKPLVQGKKPLIVMPSSCSGFESLLKNAGTKVIMKSSKNVSYIKEKLSECCDLNSVYAVSSCGLPDEKICENIEKLSEKCGYFTTIIAES